MTAAALKSTEKHRVKAQQKAVKRDIAEKKAADIKSDAAKRRVENKAAAKAAAVKKADRDAEAEANAAAKFAAVKEKEA